MKVVVIFDNLGPYHIARMNALAKVVNLHVVEEWGSSSDHGWTLKNLNIDFAKTALFPNAATRTTSKRSLRKAMTEILAQVRPDAVGIPGWSDVGALAALKWCNSDGASAVLMCATSHPPRGGNVVKEFVKSSVVSCFTSAIAGGTPQVEYLSSLGMARDRIFTGYNAVDNEYFRAGAACVRASVGEFRNRYRLPKDFFLGAWRFIPEKNTRTLLLAYAEYVQAYGADAWKLVVLGDGPLRRETESFANQLGLDDHVSFRGFIQYSDLPAYYGLANVLVLPSTKETWGLVVNEAMAAGLPVIVSTACGCHRDLVKSGENGFTFDPEDPVSLARILGDMTDNRAKLPLMGVESERIIAGWSVANFARNFKEACERSKTDLRPSVFSQMFTSCLQYI